MAVLEVRSDGVASVQTFTAFLLQLLDHAETVKPTRALEPALTKADFDDLYARVGDIFTGFDDGSGKKLRQFAIVETAVRDVFVKLVATCSIDTPDFVRVWNLFDILALLADNRECDPALLFWLIEELLDSQTIPGCRKVFDYLESRRERSVAKHFASSKLIILRTCNDLLRRLSRAEDTPFCGRVFIFLFQLFPLGDKSSVNLRGEFHVENVTTYDAAPDVPAKADGDGAGAAEGADADKMDVDGEAAAKPKQSAEAAEAAADSKGKKPEVDFDALYPVFWSLQTSFSQPKKLFEAAHFGQFRAGMEASMAAFRQVGNSSGSRNMRQIEEARRGIKRKRDNGGADDLAETYNPKYLTSRDLFELETRDLTFRRHFLLQALIMMEFLLSLSSKAKERLALVATQNKSVLYADQVLSEDDTAWVVKMKQNITDHIRYSNPDGPYFLRMVDTILARDKNWVRWKAESCPPIARPAVSAEEFVAAKDSAQRAFARHRRRSNALATASFSLDFLEDEDEHEDVDADEGKDGAPRPPPIPRNRYTLAPLEAWEKEIANEDFEIEMPDSDASKKQAEERKASKTWRALRLVRQANLALFDRIEDDNDIRVVFAAGGAAPDEADEDVASGGGGGDAAGEGDAGADADATGADDEKPADRDSLPADTRAVVLVGANDDATTSTLARLLSRRNPGVFGLVAQHTTKPAAADDDDDDGDSSEKREPAAVPLHRVDGRGFDLLLDGDKFVAFGEAGGHRYGTHKGHVDAVAAAGKVPVVLMNDECVQSARDNGFAARYVRVEPPTADGATADGAETVSSMFDKTIRLGSGAGAEADSRTEAAVKALEAYIYGTEAAVAKEAGTTTTAHADGGADSSNDNKTAAAPSTETPSTETPEKADDTAQADTAMADAAAA